MKQTLPPRYHRDRKFDNRKWDLEAEPKKLYIAASISAQKDSAQLALKLHRLGFEITSRWLELDFRGTVGPSEFNLFAPQQAANCDLDMANLVEADTLLVNASVDSSTGGYWFELGWWLGNNRGNAILVGGSRENIFAWHPDVRWFCVMNDAVSFLDSQKKYGTF